MSNTKPIFRVAQNTNVLSILWHQIRIYNPNYYTMFVPYQQIYLTVVNYLPTTKFTIFCSKCENRCRQIPRKCYTSSEKYQLPIWYLLRLAYQNVGIELTSPAESVLNQQVDTNEYPVHKTA